MKFKQELFFSSYLELFWLVSNYTKQSLPSYNNIPFRNQKPKTGRLKYNSWPQADVHSEDQNGGFNVCIPR